MNDRQRHQPQPQAARQAEKHEGRHPRHEGDEPIAQSDEDEPRSVGKQAHHDIEQGQKDTDRRGGDEYQERTQNDQHANRNSRGGQKPPERH